MAKIIDELREKVRRLKTERADHAAAIQEIDKAFTELGVELKRKGVAGKKKASTKKLAKKTVKKRIAKKTSKKKRAKKSKKQYKQTASDLVISVIKAKGKNGATSEDIAAAWKRTGRPKDRHYNILYQLRKEKKIKKIEKKGEPTIWVRA